jgi:Cytidylate kinase-like family
VPCDVICISHETGAGGEEIGRLVADRLGFLYVDEDIVVSAAAWSGIDPGKVASQERRQSLAVRALEAVAAGGAELPSLAGGLPAVSSTKHSSSDRIRAFIREAVVQTASRGNVVIVAHAASFALDPSDRNLRVLVAATPEKRTARIREAQGLDDSEAARAIKSSDAGRRDYLRRFYEVEQELPTHYDLVLNTDRLGVERAAQVILHAAGLSA